ncbi:hypothetical protein ACQEVG_29045 [Streptomyces sp. CA-135486]|uniref:hypothetical protein n=1 Tax=Streptomyces sp. CA-135486 TaxID=3240049 RepID=UPI003D89B9E8
MLSLSDRGIRQNDVEAMMWSPDAPKPVVLNYMQILHAGDVVCLTTTDEPPGRGWSEDMAARLAELFPGRRLVVRAVEQLPPLASLGRTWAGSCREFWTSTKSATGTGCPVRSR